MKKAASAAAVILIIVLIFTALNGMSFAASYANYEKAVDLKILGFLTGSENKFDLGRAPSRAEGAVMFVRLLGRESEALKTAYKHPFKGVPAWGDSYVGYMYENNLTAGIENDYFVSDKPIPALQYVTFVIRALGYDDNDFKYQEAFDMAVKIGLLSADEASVLKSRSSFIRDDMIGITYNALNVKLKGSDKTLLDKLVFDDKTIYKPAATVLGLYTSDLESEIGNIGYSPASSNIGYVANNSNDLFLIMRKSIYENNHEIKVDISGYSGDPAKDFEGVCERAYAAVIKITDVENFLDTWSYLLHDSLLTITLNYNFTKEVYETKRNKEIQAVNKARQIVSKLIEKKMSDFDKEKLLHDYIVNNTRGDVENYKAGTTMEDDFTAYGCLVRGITMCQGYSEAMQLLCELSGLECLVVNGQTFDKGKWVEHVWNIVRVDGAWYHLDTTFDDPVTSKGEDLLNYNYFNITDTDFARQNRWEKKDYPICNSVKDGYYYRNKMVAGSYTEFVKAVNGAIKQHKSRIELKIKDFSRDSGKYSDLNGVMSKSGTVSWYRCLIDDKMGIVLLFDIKYF